MISSDNLCMSCMHEIGEAKQCPHCGYRVDSAQIAPYLPVRTVVANRYLVGKVLEYNGEGATYIGWDLTEKKAVNIREFLPDGIAMRTTSQLTLAIQTGSELTYRDCLQSFREMWNKLLHLQGLPALINVTAVVEDYGTLYAVYDYIESVTFREYLLSSKTGCVSWERARQLLMPVLSTLGTLHSYGIIHRGISPTTLMVGKDGKVRISGFCIWQVRTTRGDLTAQLFPGYSAIEQYGFEGQQGAWTDIYSFGAVLYRALIGSDPIDATKRVTSDALTIPGRFAEQLPPYVVSSLVDALQILPDDRIKSVELLRAELSASPVAATTESRYTLSAQQRISPPSVSQTINADDADDDDESEETDEIAEEYARRVRKAERKVMFKAAAITVAAGIVALIIFLAGLLIFSNLNNTATGGDSEITDTGLVEVPDFLSTQMSYNSIIANDYNKKNFNFAKQSQYSETVAQGKIISQSPAPGEQVAKGSTITLMVSKGPEKFNLSENIIGRPYKEVRSELVSQGFRVERSDVKIKGTVTTAKDGDVVGCDKTLNVGYPNGTTITLQVYVAPEETTTDTTTEYVEPFLHDEPEIDHDVAVDPAGESDMTDPGPMSPEEAVINGINDLLS